MIPGSLPPTFRSAEEVLKLIPPELRVRVSAPIRDALVEALFTLIESADAAADTAAAQSDPLRAIGPEEDALWEERGETRAAGEGDEPFRERALNSSDVVTPAVIRDAVNAILAQVTPNTCRISERVLDGWFVGDGVDAPDSEWSSHFERTPYYPDRLYDFPMGDGIEGNDPGGVRVFDGTVGRLFLIRVPDISGAADSMMTTASIANTVHANGFFVNRGSFVGGGHAPNVVYDSICRTVDSIVGHSILWVLLVDPRLSDS